MSIRRETVEITGPAGTVISRPIIGEIVEVRYDGTDLNAGTRTADFTLTRLDGGGTILAVRDQAGPWQYAPRQPLHDTAGGTLLDSSQVGVIPVAGAVRVVVAQAGTATDRLSIFYRC